jgi:hypothetical protein
MECFGYPKPDLRGVICPKDSVHGKPFIQGFVFGVETTRFPVFLKLSRKTPICKTYQLTVRRARRINTRRG